MFEDQKAYAGRPPEELMPGVTWAADILISTAMREDVSEQTATAWRAAARGLSKAVEDQALARITEAWENDLEYSPQTYRAGFETGLLVAIDALQEHGRDVGRVQEMLEAQDVLIDVWPVWLDIGIPSLVEMRESFEERIGE